MKKDGEIKTKNEWKTVFLWTFGILLSPFLWWLYIIIFIFWLAKRNKKNYQESNLEGNSVTEDEHFTYIRETKCKCKACKNVWFYGKEEITHNKAIARENASTQCGNCAAALDNCGTATMCCSGCAPALLIPDKPTKDMKEGIDLNKCPKCGSRAIEKELVNHKVKK